MDFGFNRIKSYLNNKSVKETSVSLVILVCGMSLIAGAAYAADTQSNSIAHSTTTTVPPVTTYVVPELPEKPVVTTTTLPNLTLEQWGDLSVHMRNTDPVAWQVHIDSKRALHGKCGEWYDLAMQVGWPVQEWPILSKILFRESRCNYNSHNKTDPSSGSRGIMQINGFWCRPNRWTKQGWLQDKGILNTCDDLFNPATNLKAGLAIWLYGEEKHGCGWRGPWATSCN